MQDTFIDFKDRARNWAKRDWAKNNADGELIVYNNVGGIKRVVNKEEYFRRLEKCENLSDIKKWIKYVVGDDSNISEWLEEIGRI